MVLTRGCCRTSMAVLTAITFLIVGLSGIAYLSIDRDTHRDLFDYFYVGGEMNLPTWWNVGLLLGVGLCALLAGAMHRRERAAWFVIAATAALLSVDEGSRLHERAGHLAAGVAVPTFRWVVVGAVVAPVGLAFLWWATRVLPPATRRLLGASVAVYVLAALGLEAVGGYLHYTGHWRAFLVLTHVEELLEMLACIGAAWAVLRRLTPVWVTTPPSEADADAHSSARSLGGRPMSGAATGL